MAGYRAGAGFTVGGHHALVVTVNKNDLLQTDGLQDIRDAFCHAQPSEQLCPLILLPTSDEEVQLYQTWAAGLPSGHYQSAQAERAVPVFCAHEEVGVPVNQRQEAASKLWPEPCTAVLKAVIGARNARVTLASGHPEIGMQVAASAFVK